MGTRSRGEWWWCRGVAGVGSSSGSSSSSSSNTLVLPPLRRRQAGQGRAGQGGAAARAGTRIALAYLYGDCGSVALLYSFSYQKIYNLFACVCLVLSFTWTAAVGWPGLVSTSNRSTTLLVHQFTQFTQFTQFIHFNSTDRPRPN